MIGSPLREEGMSLLAVVIVIGVPMLVLATVRLAMPGERLVVVRGGRIVRLPRCRVSLVVPGIEQAKRWPPGAIRAPVTVRAETVDGLEVRALVTLELVPDPPLPGQRYADPLTRLEASAEEALGSALSRRPVRRLLDPATGLAAAVAGLELEGGRISCVDVEEIDVLLGPPGSV